MDEWPPEPQRHKRSREEMSQQASISPSAIQFIEPSSSQPSSRYPSVPSSNTRTIAPSFLERRRTSHPHNRPVHIQSLHRASEDMAEISQPQSRPRLEHRSSQTIIDLTDEPDEIGPVSRGPSRRPPQLGRSDASGLMEFIDLTDDDIVITGGRELPRPRAQENRHARDIHFAPMRDDSPSLFIPHPPHPPHAIRRVFANPMNAIGVALGFRIPEVRGAAAPHHEAFHAAHFVEHMQILRGMDAQNMPGLMDYRQPAFAAPKPEHVPPKPARENFTRSPKEDDIIICPSCEEELVHKKDVEEPVVKKTGRAPSRKDREEHPFWVIKECGHVYCNNCYQNRGHPGKTPASVSFPEISKPGKNRTTKILTCAVEDCDSDVKAKDKWVGVFL
ncbi:uncharacterized protein BP5553_03872 [Venustampulla echinocandica]|uniref:Cell cycle control protein n=1 Tax=Venustampulla echinocandica TaxID=2656787 RepID=A0A370TVG8_9HELO|nr:uncharacterized protein BP5553_03872 [Venustampulla echinocandica]RDL39532.1 hypothetical protein BP5553_03872 [Venustampulla echinocandica]